MLQTWAVWNDQTDQIRVTRHSTSEEGRVTNSKWLRYLDAVWAHLKTFLKSYRASEQTAKGYCTVAHAHALDNYYHEGMKNVVLYE